MKYCIIVIVFHTELNKISTCFWCFFRPKFNVNITDTRFKTNLNDGKNVNSILSKLRETPKANAYLSVCRWFLIVYVAHILNSIQNKEYKLNQKQIDKKV